MLLSKRTKIWNYFPKDKLIIVLKNVNMNVIVRNLYKVFKVRHLWENLSSCTFPYLLLELVAFFYYKCKYLQSRRRLDLIRQALARSNLKVRYMHIYVLSDIVVLGYIHPRRHVVEKHFSTCIPLIHISDQCNPRKWVRQNKIHCMYILLRKQTKKEMKKEMRQFSQLRCTSYFRIQIRNKSQQHTVVAVPFIQIYLWLNTVIYLYLYLIFCRRPIESPSSLWSH